MAGNGSRFKAQGYKRNKYELPLGKMSLFQRALLSFKKYFNEEKFCFAYRSDLIEKKWIIDELTTIGLVDKVEYVAISGLTKGQADTAYLAVTKATASTQDRLLIFNIDSFYLEPIPQDVFIGNQSTIDLVRLPGSHWSFAKLNEFDDILEVAEKKRISDYCSTGLYHFERIDVFLKAFGAYEFEGLSEMYVMPLYNYLLQKGFSVKGRIINDNQFVVAGTPAEYLDAADKFDW
jgi:hypothetical protein